jgi:hypothetical protein
MGEPQGDQNENHGLHPHEEGNLGIKINWFILDE